jgi:hypothetical protein
MRKVRGYVISAVISYAHLRKLATATSNAATHCTADHTGFALVLVIAMQLDVLRKQEMQRQQKAVRARQLGERQDVQVNKL